MGLPIDRTRTLFQGAVDDRTSTHLPASSDGVDHGRQDRPTAGAGDEFIGTARFTIRRRIGSGAFGVVYEARDRTKQTAVALKTLRSLTPESLYRFKREFRSLADVTHPNVVQLYELVSEGGYWFFTMELIHGLHFLDWVRSSTEREGAETAGQGHETRLEKAPVDRLTAGLRQLVSGLDALHSSGHVHRDVKPSNVLGTHDDRVVVVDFGLVTDVMADAESQSLQLAGTPVYMSPEQAAGRLLTPASDWYSVGTMLYEALTGRVPFSGNYFEILAEKQQTDPPPPSSVAESVPPQLDELCRWMLCRDPSRRPDAHAIFKCLAKVGDSAPANALQAIPSKGRASHALVGRDGELARLQEAFDAVCAGTPMIVAVSGPSGIGKSALIRTFLKRLRLQRPDAVILGGQCYERESVPYKAIDALVDSIAAYLRHLPPLERTAVLPRDLAAMSVLFPVLQDVFSQSPSRVSPHDPQEARRRAYSGLRELLARTGDKHSLVLAVDDLQWGDVDSAALLNELVRLPDAPVMLVIASYRDVELETSPFLQSFLTKDLTGRPSFVQLSLAALREEDAIALASTLLGPDSSEWTVAHTIASESGGSPFFINELVRFAESGERLAVSNAPAAEKRTREASLKQLINARLSRLAFSARRCLQLVSVNARPIPEQVLQLAADADGFETAVGHLRSERLVRARHTIRGTEFEAYHDTIREAVVASLSKSELRACHEDLARAFDQDASADPELLAEHFLGAGNRSEAARYTLLAAETAEQVLAFDRAARLYRRALDFDEALPLNKRTLLFKLASSLSNAGRCVEAASIFVSIPALSAAEALDYKSRAAQQLLFGGRVEEGLGVAREVLGAIGMNLPESRWQTIATLAIGRLRARLRGLDYQERGAETVSPDVRVKLEACWSVSAGLSIVDTVRGAALQTRHLLLAINQGDLTSVHRALSLEIAFLATRGPSTRARVDKLKTITERLASRIGSPYANAMHRLASGAADYLVGQWSAAASALVLAEEILAEECTGVIWELDSARFFGLSCQWHLGEFRVIADRFPQLLADAQDRGDVYACTALRGHFGHMVHLARADLEAASGDTAEAIRDWSGEGFHQPHLWNLWSLTNIALYEQRGLDAWLAVQKTWRPLRRSLLLYVQYNRIVMLDLKGRAAIAAAFETAQNGLRESLLDAATRCATRLEHEGVRWAAACAQLLRAGVQRCLGREQSALELITQAHNSFIESDMTLLAEVAGRRRGELMGGTHGAALVAESDRFLRSRGVSEPSAIARMFAPWNTSVRL